MANTKRKVVSTQPVPSASPEVMKEIILSMMEKPLFMIPVIQTIMDPSNPDSKSLKDTVIKSILEAVKKDKRFMKMVKMMIIDNADNITRQSIAKTFMDKEGEISKAIRTTIDDRCTKFIDAKIKGIDTIFDEYFVKLRETIDAKIEEAQNKTIEYIKEQQDKLTPSDGEDVIRVPNDISSEVKKYVEFLKNK